VHLSIIGLFWIFILLIIEIFVEWTAHTESVYCLATFTRFICAELFTHLIHGHVHDVILIVKAFYLLSLLLFLLLFYQFIKIQVPQKFNVQSIEGICWLLLICCGICWTCSCIYHFDICLFLAERSRVQLNPVQWDFCLALWTILYARWRNLFLLRRWPSLFLFTCRFCANHFYSWGLLKSFATHHWRLSLKHFTYMYCATIWWFGLWVSSNFDWTCSSSTTCWS